MDQTLRIGFAGDVMLGRTLDHILDERGYWYPWGDVLPIMQQTDLNIINLETALTNSEDKVLKTFNFKAKPDKVESLVKARITVVNLANNHVLDYGESGLIETLNTLKGAGIKYVGAGMNLEEAESPEFVEIKGIRVGVIGMTDNESTWKAGKGPGTNYLEIESEKDRAKVLQTIEKARRQCDCLVVSIHWGPNMVESPPEEFVQFAHSMIDHGANIIHGHSAHIFQAVEQYHGGLILYDTGDFVDDYVVDPLLRNDRSAFFEIYVGCSGVKKLEVIPVRIFDYQANKAIGEDYQWVMRRFQKSSSEFDTVLGEDGVLNF
ncbi:CapA family protein [Algoriphagus sp. CAU 1675]|uniref:CapA family protein n=1 Tax=Algoriphagus sp. CAU 1675 TaxID=3032597 RepID=UPI0023D9EBCE|nr:CapA family protein [Algoriphagus sp. CAU 1675]MDF2157176.1 CapA family protein [Algoriphagus sp. CAU 1675]